MKNIEYSVFCTLLLFILSELALAADMLISDKEATAPHVISDYKIDFSRLVIDHLKDKVIRPIKFSRISEASCKFHDIYVTKDGTRVRVNDNPDSDHILKRLQKLICTGCNPLELKYQATWGCSSAGHVYHVLKGLYPAETDFQSLLAEVSIKSVSNFANESHVVGELFSLELKTVGTENNSQAFYFFHLWQGVYALIFDSSMILLPKKSLIALIHNLDDTYSSDDFVLNIYQRTTKPSEPFSILGFAEAYYHFTINHPYLCILQKGILLAGSALLVYFSRRATQSNTIETTNTKSEQKPGKHPDNAAGDLFSKKPEDSISPFSSQIGETVMPTAALALNQETQTVNNTRELTDQELNNIVTELQTAHRDGVDLASRQVRLLRALRDIVQRLNENNISYDLMDIITRNLHVSTNLRKAIKVVGSLNFAGDGIPDTLIKKLSKRFR